MVFYFCTHRMSNARTSLFRRSRQNGYSVHNKVKLVRGGKDFFDILIHVIAQARHVIHFQIYIFDEDDTGMRVASALKDASRRGVKVFLMVDGYASKGLSRIFVDDLKGAGVHFRRFQPLLKSRKFFLGRRLHHKVVVVDDFYSLVGGLNVSDRYNDTPAGKAWLDWAVLCEGDIAAQLSRVCTRRYNMRGKVLTDHHLPPTGALNIRHHESHVRVRINDWIGRRQEITNTYLEMFKTANSRVLIMSPYFLPGRELRMRMKQAVQRGVAIKVIQAGISDIPMSKYAERFLYRWLFKNKVQIYEYQNSVLHGKVGICDGKWMTIGSYNLNNLSAYISIELNLEVADGSFAKSSEERLQEIIDQECVLITEDHYNKNTGWWSRLFQMISYNLLRLALFVFTRRRE